MKKVMLIFMLGVLLVGVVNAVPTPCSEEELLESSTYGIEGVVKNVVCGDTWEDTPCTDGPTNTLQNCIATIELTKVLQGDYVEGDEIEIPFNKIYEFGGYGCVPGSFAESFEADQKVRYYDASGTCIWNRLTKIDDAEEFECETEQDCIDSGECSEGIECTCLEGECMEGLPVNPDECPKFSPPADDWCEDGKIVTRGFDDNGCKLPPKCILGKEAIQERKKIHFEERTGQECPEGCRCQGVTTTCPLEDGGREMTVYARSGDIVFQTKGVRAVTTVALYHHNGFVYGVFKNNVTKKILLPDEVKEKISARLQKKLDKHDIELDEDGFYHVRAKKAARFLWLIPVKETVRFEIDAETGEMIKKRTSWWGFLAKDVEEEI